MKIQRFSGQDVQEALRLARLALGADAVILQTRRVPPSGLMKLVGRPRVEVLAAIDTPETAAGGPYVGPQAQRGAAAAAAALKPPSLRRAPRAADVCSGRADSSGASGLTVGAAEESVGGAATPATMASDGRAGDWRRELDALRGELANLRLQLQFTQCLPRPGEDPAADQRAQSLQELADRLVAGVVTQTIEIREGACTTVAVVGPTGVGKTTTIAKLAAAATRVECRRVAFITMDTYRIGAVEQLETYAKLLDVPLSVACSPEEMRAARDRYAEYDLIFVDTVGRPPGNESQLDELADLLSLASPDEIHLALDARGSYATHRSVLRGFGRLGPTHLLLSKLDEAPRLEDSLAAALEGGLPVSYITTGQRVPEDVAPADRAQLAGWLIGGQ